MTQIPPKPAEVQRFSDGVLLRRFVQDADEVAFGVIVERHAPLVMSVCRRVVGQTADCDDAFQATFYALSQRPVSIRECRSLTGWLYSVAWRTSVRLIRLRKRSKMETLPDHVQAPDPDPLDQIAEANNLSALDEELNQLPEKYRHVLVMSYFAQQTNQEIADELNESKGAVDGRIREARRILRVRLARRGVEIGALLVAGSLVQSASAAVSPQLIATTSQLAKLSSGFSSTVTVSGVDLNQLQILSSTGTTVMGIKAGTFLATGVLMLSGAVGLSQLMARQDAVNPENGGSVVSAAVAGQDASTATPEPIDAEVAASSASPAERSDATSSGDGSDGTMGMGAGMMAADGLGGDMMSEEAGSMPGMTGGSSAAPASGVMAEFSRAGARKVEERLNSTMNSARVPPLKFDGEVALEEILRVLENSMSVEVQATIPVRFIVDETDPDISGDPEFLRTVMIRGVSIAEDSMTMASALDLILRKVKHQDLELTWIIEKEVVLITTEASAESEDRVFIRSYDVKKLRPMFEEMAEAVPTVADYPEGGFGGGGRDSGVPPEPPMVESTWQRCLVNEIRSLTMPPCLWLDNGDEFGTMSVVGHRLIVQQTRSGHEAVVEVLESLEQGIDVP